MQKFSSNNFQWNNLKKVVLFIIASIFLSIVLLKALQYTDNFGYLVPRPLSLLLTFLWLFVFLPLSLFSAVAMFMVVLKPDHIVTDSSLFLLTFCLLFFIISVSTFFRSREESISFEKLGEKVVRAIELYKKQNSSYPKELPLVSDTFAPDEQKILQNQFDYAMIKSDSEEGFSLRYEFRSFSWLQGCKFASSNTQPVWNCYPD